MLHEQPGAVAREELQTLISAVEDLVQRLATAADPEVKRLRQQSETALANAKSALADGGARLRDRVGTLGEQGQQYLEQYQEYTRRRPLLSLGLVAAGMLVIGLVAGRSLPSD